MGINVRRIREALVACGRIVTRHYLLVGVFWLVAVCARPCGADIVLYPLPGTPFALALQGKATINPGSSISFKHSKFGLLYFDHGQVQIHRVDSPDALLRRKRLQAKGNPNQLMQAATWALEHGMLRAFYETVAEVLRLDPNHKRAKLVQQLKQRIDRPLGDYERQEKELRKLVGLSNMKIKASAHYLLLYDTDDKRANERLKLLESVYEVFLMRFFAHGVELEVPDEYLKVVLFHEQGDFQLVAKRQTEDAINLNGFWDPATNTSMFYDQATGDMYKAFRRISSQFEQLKEQAKRTRGPGTKETVRLANTLSLLAEVVRESEDVKVVSHEATHQLAGNTGLLPRHVMIPRWVHEGLAAYFETPEEAAWSGIGAVNSDRLEWYRALARDQEHSSIEFVVSDKIFDLAASSIGVLHGYGQGWALTHFLMDQRFEEFMGFYRRLGEMPPHTLLTGEVVLNTFDSSFAGGRENLELQWRAYMRKLKTDLEEILDEE